ncbi:rhamnogalacturonan acetylesterase [Coralloluteibacterium stylophorae]|uniref:Rhamnogalacturonan acetylesterase n=1 Tax=Coralloluteibacterium stylophorae TaxID=1776034 RepID=A0AAP2CDT6_9GAMM|nr:rhamnogalacturonan acetylesterase [Coralloluteibacterium stylophorae]MBS7458509.1 rhamnogalacturonan acetylesterase [Coralloluteibacterium stylophorae]
MIRAALLCALLPLVAVAQESRPPATPIHADKIVLVGDSTTAVQGGWGPAFCAHHVTSFVACVDLARGGRSSYSYRAEGSWDLALAEMRVAGYDEVWVLVQFGHNDQPGKPGRSTDLEREFPQNLRRYVAEIRAAGARPVLLTPLTRRQFEDGRLLDDLAPWAEAVRTVARETATPLLDLHARSREIVQALGPVQAMRLAQVAPPSSVVAAAQGGTTVDHDAPPPARGAAADGLPPLAQAKPSFDYTHLGDRGAEVFAALVADELSRIEPELRGRLIP